MPAKILFFQYDWKKEIWNLFFVFGIFIGGILTAMYFKDDQAIVVNPTLINELSGYGLTEINGLVPEQLFAWSELSMPRGLIMMTFGGFLVGFSTRYAGGCTSGHAIMGLSNF